jgi:uncharacterized protein with PIN domain
MDENAAQEDGVFYVLEIHGFAPEFMDGIAFRIDKSKGARRRKEVKCPYCGRLFETVDAETRIEIHRMPHRTGVFCHTCKPCRRCHGVVGIKFA